MISQIKMNSLLDMHMRSHFWIKK